MNCACLDLRRAPGGTRAFAPQSELQSVPSERPAALATPPARALTGPSGGLYGNAPRLFLRALGDGDFQHPVDVRCLDRLGIDTLREREAAQERAGGTLDALEAVLGRLLLRAALAL